jgi:hypothetical protein
MHECAGMTHKSSRIVQLSTERRNRKQNEKYGYRLVTIHFRALIQSHVIRTITNSPS